MPYFRQHRWAIAMLPPEAGRVNMELKPNLLVYKSRDAATSATDSVGNMGIRQIAGWPGIGVLLAAHQAELVPVRVGDYRQIL